MKSLILIAAFLAASTSLAFAEADTAKNPAGSTTVNPTDKPSGGSIGDADLKDKAAKGGETVKPTDKPATGAIGDKDLKDKAAKAGKTADPTDQPPTGGTGDAAKAEQTGTGDESTKKQ